MHANNTSSSYLDINAKYCGYCGNYYFLPQKFSLHASHLTIKIFLWGGSLAREDLIKRPSTAHRDPNQIPCHDFKRNGGLEIGSWINGDVSMVILTFITIYYYVQKFCVGRKDRVQVAVVQGCPTELYSGKWSVTYADWEISFLFSMTSLKQHLEYFHFRCKI